MYVNSKGVHRVIFPVPKFHNFIFKVSIYILNYNIVNNLLKSCKTNNPILLGVTLNVGEIYEDKNLTIVCNLYRGCLILEAKIISEDLWHEALMKKIKEIFARSLTSWRQKYDNYIHILVSSNIFSFNKTVM